MVSICKFTSITYRLIFDAQKAKFDYSGNGYLTYKLTIVFAFSPYFYKIFG